MEHCRRRALWQSIGTTARKEEEQIMVMTMHITNYV